MPSESATLKPTALGEALRATSALLLVLLTLPASPGAEMSLRAHPGQIAGTLDPILRVYPKPVENALHALKRGVDLYSEGKYAQALQLLPDADGPDGFLLTDYAALWRGRSYLKANRSQEAVRTFRQMRSRFPDSPLAKEAVLGECEASLALGNAASALALLDSPGITVDAAVLYRRGLAEEAAGRAKPAQSSYLRVYCDYVKTDEAELARQRLLALSPGFMASPGNLRPLLQRAENLLRAGRDRDARALLVRHGGIRPPDAGASQWRRVMLADAEQRLGRSSKALGILLGISATDAEIQARAIYLRAVCYRTLKRESALLKTRDLALRLHPQSPWTERVLYLVAAHYDVDNRADQLEAAYSELITRFPGGRYAERASWKLAFCAWTQKRYGEALARFSRHMKSWPEPESALGSAYWMGRCYESLGDTLNALLLYRRAQDLANHSYYGRLAQEAAEVTMQKGAGTRYAGSEADVRQALRLLDGIKQAPVIVPQPTGPVAAAVERARQLIAADLPEQAISELRSASLRYRQDKAIAYVAARIHERSGDYLSSIGELSRAFRGYALLPPASLPGEVSGLLFPTHYLDLVQTHSAAHRLDPAIVLGLIRQESAFMADARSHANARGLMQVLPSTGRQLARQAGVRGYTTAKLYQPDTNIALGTHHLSSLLELFAGKIELALAGYNAGTYRAQRWLVDFGGVDMAEFVERIPLAETRQYVKQVLTNSAHYRVLLSR